MHKKRIKGKSYFYTSYRDEQGKVKTKYLGSDYSSAKLEEKRFSTISNKKVPEPNYKIQPLAFLILFFGLLISLSYFLGGGITGFSTLNTASQEDFDEGVYSQTFYNTSDNFIQLNISEGYTAGNYTSKVIDASKAVTWDNISWIESAPYGEELPNNQEDELASGIFGGANMTGNVLLMHFNNDTTLNATHIYDFSGNQNNGTALGGAHPNLTDYKLGGGAFEFDGDDDYVDLGSIQSGNLLMLANSELTISAWINKRSSGDTHQRIIDKSDGSSATNGYAMWIDSQKIGFSVGGNSWDTDDITAINYNEWAHIMIVHSTISTTAYVDGIEKSGSYYIGSHTLPSDATTNMKIGTWNHDVAREFNGTIDEIAIWNRTLSAEEVMNNYKRGALRLNLTVRSCDDATCDIETWRDVNDTSPQNLSVSNNRYFQYRFGFETDDSSFSPELYNVTINNYNAVPGAEGVSIYNATAHFNTSIFGYANYTDAEFDDSNGTSQYKWFVNGILNKTGNTSQLLLCHFNNNYTCEEGETANIIQYHREFNTSKEQINITLTEKNSSIVYVNIPKTATITEAFMNVSGYLTSPYDLLQYDSQINATYRNPGDNPGSAYYIAGVKEGIGIDSWFLLNNTPAGVNANMLSIRYGDTSGTTPTNGNFSYNIKICPTQLEKLFITQTNNPDDNCTSAYIDIIDTVNLSSNFTDNAGWQNFTFKDNISITFNNDYNFLVKFEFVDGDLSTDRWWEMYLVDDNTHPPVPSYVGYNYSSYIGLKGNQMIQFYSKSRCPKGVEIYVGNDGNNNIFADVNKSFDTTNTTADFTSAINTYLSTCPDTYCDIPINVSSNSSGVIGLEALRVSYDHYDMDGKFSEGIPANNTYTTKYSSDNNIHNHNGTLDIWVKPYWDGDDGNEYTFFTDSDNIIQLNKSSANKLVFYVDSETISCDISTWAARTWYLITATWNQGENIYLYINGSNCDSAAAPISISGLGEFIFIGSGAENNSQANSTIDDLRITGFPRESDEISNYFSENRAFFQNEIFLNSTDTQIKRDDEIIFEFTPVDSTGEGTPENSTALIISNYPPTAPILNYPLNNSYTSLPKSFSWNNGTDYDKEDAMYYVLQIDDSPEFTEPVTHYNGSISETSSPTHALVDGVSEGNYSWRVFSSDLTANSSSEIRYVTLDLTAPNLTLTSNHYKFLSVNSSDTDKNITFFFNVSEQNPLENCTFNLNGTSNPTVNLTLTHINQTENNFTQTLAFGGYNWSINCTDIANNINTTGKTILSFVAYSNFLGKGRTTNFSEIDDPSNVSNLTLEEPEYGVINFTGVDLDLSTGIDIDSYVSISFNEIKIDGAGIPELDSPANLTLFNLTSTDIYALKDGVNCTVCTEIDSSPAAYTFSITSAGTYTTQGIPLPPTPPPTPTGGSGGGGGTKTLTKVRSFTFDTNQPNSERFVLQMKRNAPAFEKISIKNNGDLPLVLTLSHNLGTHLEISPKQSRLEPEDTKAISANFYAGNPGIHVGRIIITTDTFQKIIPVTLEVRSEKIIVDSKMDIPLEYTELKQGDPLKAQVTLFNTGSIKVPIVITYLIKDLEGNIVLEEVETFDILNKKSFIKTFDTINLKTGSYITGMNVRYKDSFATSSARFEIKDGQVVKKPIFEFKWYYIMIIISLFILIILLKLYTTEFSKVIRKKRRKLKKYEE